MTSAICPSGNLLYQMPETAFFHVALNDAVTPGIAMFFHKTLIDSLYGTVWYCLRQCFFSSSKHSWMMGLKGSSLDGFFHYDTKQMSVEELKGLIWRYFLSYWNNQRSCSANGRLPPMIKRRQFYGIWNWQHSQ